LLRTRNPAIFKTSQGVHDLTGSVRRILAQPPYLVVSSLAEITTIIPLASIKAVLYLLILSAITDFKIQQNTIYFEILLQRQNYPG
jgi:hypothetical protein